MLVLAYIASIAAVNFGFAHLPLIETPFGMWPPMSLAVGFVFVLRDFAQRAIGHYVILAMLAGAALSWWMASPYVAVASGTAFLISELADWAVYTWTRRPLHQRILYSSALGTPIDSAMFLLMIGHFSWAGVVLMTASKMVGALVVSGWFTRCRVGLHTWLVPRGGQSEHQFYCARCPATKPNSR